MPFPSQHLADDGIFHHYRLKPDSRQTRFRSVVGCWGVTEKVPLRGGRFRTVQERDTFGVGWCQRDVFGQVPIQGVGGGVRCRNSVTVYGVLLFDLLHVVEEEGERPPRPEQGRGTRSRRRLFPCLRHGGLVNVQDHRRSPRVDVGEGGPPSDTTRT